MSTVFTLSQQVQFPDCVHLLDNRHLHLSPRHRPEHIAPLAPSFTSHDRDRNPYYARIDTAYQQLPHLQRSDTSGPPSSKMITASPRKAGAETALYVAWYSSQGSTSHSL